MFWEYCSFSGLNQKHEYSQTNVLANGCLFMHTSIKGIQILKNHNPEKNDLTYGK